MTARAVAIMAVAAVWMVSAAGAAARPLVWSPPALIDTAPSGEAFSALSCPSVTLCVAPDDNGGVATTTDPGGSAGWTVTRLTGYRTLTSAPSIVSLSCASITLCVGVDFGGDVYSTTDPTGGPGAWRHVALPTDGTGPSISCPTTGLCVLVFSDLGVVYTTSDPTGGSRAWARSTLPGSNSSLSGVACASATFCAIAGGDGLVFTSTDPAGGGGTYVAHRVVAATGGRRPGITAIACPTAALCVAGDATGDVLTSTDPGTAGSVWSAQRVDPGTVVSAVGCRVSGICMAIDDNGVLYASPAAGAASPRWIRVGSDARVDSYYQGTATFAVACPDDTLCLAVDGSPDLPRSTAPTVAGSWRISPPSSDIGAPLSGVSCPSLRLCVAVDTSGNVISTRTPEALGSWRSSFVDPMGALEGISCPSRSFCVATDTFGDVLISTDPTGGARSWRRHQIENGEAGGNGPPTGLMGVSCVSRHFCLTGDQNPGDELTATNPWGGAHAWHEGPGTGVIAVSCPSVRLCEVIDANGGILAITPADSTHSRSYTTVAFGLDAISCSSSALCVAVAGGEMDENDADPGGGIWSATNPASAHPRWRLALPDANEELAVACHASALCLAVDVNGRASASLDPAAAHPGWSTKIIDRTAVFTGVACPTRRVCIVVDGSGRMRIASVARGS